LRRAANAIVKILAESRLRLSLADVIAASGVEGAHRDQAAAFFRERLSFYLKDVRGFAYDVVNAVLAAGADDVRDAIARAEALTAVRGSEDFAAISIAFKRIKNILRQAGEKGFALGSWANVQAAEALSLRDVASRTAPRLEELRRRREYPAALALIATLRPSIDAFFDKVMVLDADETLRGAHLDLIHKILEHFSTIADFSEIVAG
jgi:glycyl-tRNA synthetase beta chain